MYFGQDRTNITGQDSRTGLDGQYTRTGQLLNNATGIQVQNTISVNLLKTYDKLQAKYGKQGAT